MKSINGDLIELAIEGKFDVIIHGCNCQCTMGSGIAKTIKARFPEAYQADLKTLKGSREKLGTISEVTILLEEHEITVVNGYTQFHWKGSGPLVEYDALKEVMKIVKERFSGKRIGYPKIGAGLAGGDWSVIAAIIEKELEGEDHTLVNFQST